jgi:tRNA-Thr(GGU) m(6)t(6)A37 methyltransferase TsaA
MINLLTYQIMNEMVLKQIGVIRSEFKKATDTPIQTAVAGDHAGEVDIFEEYVEGLKDLIGFDRIWLIYWCDRAAHPKLTVRPYLDRKPHGVFATRAPSRPNPLGISAVRLHKIEGNKLYISGVDILDGTPLVDIKPYAPRFDHFEVERSGWLDNTDTARTTADDRFERSEEE